MLLLLSLVVSLLAAPSAVGTDLPRFSQFSYEGHAQEQVSAAKGEYRNPILSGYYPDPSVTRVDDDYYLVLSSFAHFPGLPVFRSKDLVNWTQIGNAIDRTGQLDFTGLRTSQAVFAPDISYHGGTFYIVGTCVACRGNFVLTAKQAAGPWSDPMWLPFEGIDPSIYWEGDRAYIVNNRAPAEPPRYDGHRAIWIQEYDWRTGKMVGDSTQLINGGVDIARKPVWIEGPHLLKRHGWYYLTAAEGGTSLNHSQVVLRSRTLRGPYVAYTGNPILTQRDLDPDRPHPITSAGHAKLVQTQRGDWWATFLAVRPYEGDYYNIGRETFLLPVSWREGWPVILPAGKAIPFVAPKPNLPPQPRAPLPTSGDFAYVDQFDGERLGLAWVGVRTPKTALYRLEAGDLVLNAGGRLGDISGVPGFVARRQQHDRATMRTTLRFTPGKDGERAGLAAMQSDRNYLFFGVTRLAGRPCIALYTSEDGTEQLLATAPLATTGPVTLTIRADRGTMSFAYAARGASGMLKSGVDVRFLSTKAATGFVGTLVGPYTWLAS